MRPRPARSARTARTASTAARTAALLAALPLALAACGGGGDTISPEDVPASEAPPATTPDAELSASPSVEAPPAGSAASTPGAPQEERGQTRPVPVSELEPGMCFDDVPGALNEVTEVPVVPCDGPHANEVFVVLQQPGEQFPGEEEIRGLADEGCYASFESYVGAPVETSTLTPFPITPTATSWEQGDRTVVCVLTSRQPRTSSARGSGA